MRKFDDRQTSVRTWAIWGWAEQMALHPSAWTLPRCFHSHLSQNRILKLQGVFCIPFHFVLFDWERRLYTASEQRGKAKRVATWFSACLQRFILIVPILSRVSTMLDNLPVEILHQIFSELPPSDLLQTACLNARQLGIITGSRSPVRNRLPPIKFKLQIKEYKGVKGYSRSHLKGFHDAVWIANFPISIH